MVAKLETLNRESTYLNSMKQSSLDWLLEPEDPPIRFHTLHDILGRSLDDPRVREARKKIRTYSPVRKILSARNRDGYWPPGETCYRPKWTSTVWPLMLLGEMGLPSDEKIKGACERFLELHQLGNGAFSCPSRNEKVSRRWEEPCLTGNMVRTLHMLGYDNDPRIKKAVNWMPEAQLDDGGWNCDWPERKVKHSSFMSTIEPLWAYSEIPRQKWTRKMKRSINQGAEFLLMHRVYKSDNHHWKPSLPFFTALHFPMYYFYDALHGLRVLAKLGYGDDERTSDAVHLLLSKRRPDGKWLLDGDWDREILLGEKSRGDGPAPKERKRVVTVEELGKPSKWVTLNCYRALAKTGDLSLSRK